MEGKDPDKRKIISDFCLEANEMVSLTESMKKIFLDKIPNLGKVHIIENSACIETASTFSLKTSLVIIINTFFYECFYFSEFAIRL